jgi:signal-transduction protein with cAMP-binding, CBS, and nucleotidyltransferase domain
MADVGGATPLIALDAVVIDSETTSLDPAKARIVEIAAVRLVAGRVDTADAFRRLVDLLLAQQTEDLERGRPLSNAVAVRPLSSRDRDRLRSALEAVGHIEDIMRGLLF